MRFLRTPTTAVVEAPILPRQLGRMAHTSVIFVIAESDLDGFSWKHKGRFGSGVGSQPDPCSPSAGGFDRMREEAGCPLASSLSQVALNDVRCRDMADQVRMA